MKHIVIAALLVWVTPVLVVAQPGAEEDPYAPIVMPSASEGDPSQESAAEAMTIAPTRQDRVRLSPMQLFWSSPRLRNSALMAAIAAFALGLVGIYVVFRRVVFVTACLANVSGVGVALAVALGWHLDHGAEATAHALSALAGPFGMSLALTVLAATAFAWWRPSPRLSRESVLGVAYVLSAAALLLLARIAHQSPHDIDELVFGNAVLVDPSHYVVLPLFAALVVGVHVVFRKDFVFASFDPVSARAGGYPVQLLDVALFVTIAVAVGLGTHALGALPVFGFVVLPPLAAVFLTDRLGLIFVLSPLIALVSAVLGYLFAFWRELPVGPSMTCTAALFLVCAAVSKQIRKGQ